MDKMYDDGKAIDTMPNTRKEILNLMRYQLSHIGPWSCGDWDYITDRQEKRAKQIVQAAFPELYDSETKRNKLSQQLQKGEMMVSIRQTPPIKGKI